MSFSDSISAIGSILSGIASVAAVWFTAEVRREQKQLKVKIAEFYIEKAKIRIEGILHALLLNFLNEGEVNLIIHRTARDFNGISKDGYENSISVEVERILEEILSTYNGYLHEYWISKENPTEWLIPTSVRDKEVINMQSKACYDKINELYLRLEKPSGAS